MEKGKMRIALVNQRYGLEVNGGSEYYTRQLAEHMAGLYDVEVLTTRALDYGTWENYYEKDEEQIHGIRVRRFPVERKRDTAGMKFWNRIGRYLPFMRRYCENRWIDAQGPYSPDLIQFIESHVEDYDIFLFVTYLYYHSVRGIPKVAGRAVLLPTAHDEPYIYFSIYQDVFQSCKGLIYLTPEEKSFVERMFSVKQYPNCVTGAGVEVPPEVDEKSFREAFGIDGEYFIYAGRIDPAKGCDEMFRIFRMYKEKNQESGLKLVLMGKAMMEIPEAEDLIYLGFVSEKVKFDGISGARALWLPSKYESLSIAVLEALALGVPVLVDGRCEVLKGHCMRSKAGWYYKDDDEALESLKRLLTEKDREALSDRAKKYIQDNYQWDIILEKMGKLLTEIRS